MKLTAALLIATAGALFGWPAAAQDPGDPPATLGPDHCSQGYSVVQTECLAPPLERVEQAVKVIAEPVPPTLPPAPPPGEEGPGFLERLESSGLASWVAESRYGYPAVLGLHVIGLVLVVGLLIFVDLRLLNVIGDNRLSALPGPIKLAWFGLAINAVSGCALFAAQATFFIDSKPFLIKIGLVFLGAIIALHIQRQVTKHIDDWAAGSLPASIKAAAAVSLLCWLGVLLFGGLIPYIGSS